MSSETCTIRISRRARDAFARIADDIEGETGVRFTTPQIVDLWLFDGPSAMKEIVTEAIGRHASVTERHRASQSVTACDAPSQSVTERHRASQSVTACDAPSQSVTAAKPGTYETPSEVHTRAPERAPAHVSAGAKYNQTTPYSGFKNNNPQEHRRDLQQQYNPPQDPTSREREGVSAAAPAATLEGESLPTGWIVERWNAWAAPRAGVRTEDAQRLDTPTANALETAWRLAPYRERWESAFADLDALPEYARQRLSRNTSSLRGLCSEVGNRKGDGPLVYLLADYRDWAGDKSAPQRGATAARPTTDPTSPDHQPTWEEEEALYARLNAEGWKPRDPPPDWLPAWARRQMQG